MRTRTCTRVPAGDGRRPCPPRSSFQRRRALEMAIAASNCTTNINATKPGPCSSGGSGGGGAGSTPVLLSSPSKHLSHCEAGAAAPPLAACARGSRASSSCGTAGASAQQLDASPLPVEAGTPPRQPARPDGHAHPPMCALTEQQCVAQGCSGSGGAAAQAEEAAAAAEAEADAAAALVGCSPEARLAGYEGEQRVRGSPRSVRARAMPCALRRTPPLQHTRAAHPPAGSPTAGPGPQWLPQGPQARLLHSSPSASGPCSPTPDRRPHLHQHPSAAAAGAAGRWAAAPDPAASSPASPCIISASARAASSCPTHAAAQQPGACGHSRGQGPQPPQPPSLPPISATPLSRLLPHFSRPPLQHSAQHARYARGFGVCMRGGMREGGARGQARGGGGGGEEGEEGSSARIEDEGCVLFVPRHIHRAPAKHKGSMYACSMRGAASSSAVALDIEVRAARREGSRRAHCTPRTLHAARAICSNPPLPLLQPRCLHPAPPAPLGQLTHPCHFLPPCRPARLS